MKWLNVVIKYRLWLGILFLGLAIFTHIQTSFWPSFVLYLIAAVAIVGHFFLTSSLGHPKWAKKVQ
jgi:hypothetical protein